jgi:predicted outer membrane repeat protein
MAVLGDLDITDSVTIKGAGSGLTIVDGNGSVTRDRVFQVFAGASDTTFSGLVIRNGKKNAGTFDEGGGLYWQGGGGRLSLSDVVVEDNRASYGGGMALIFSSTSTPETVDLNRLTIRGNKATAAAGGALADLSSGAQLDLRNSRIHANTAHEGGGLYLQGDAGPDEATSLRVRNTVIDANTASLSAGFENRSGTVAVPVVLADDFLHGNSGGFYGGAIGNFGVMDMTASTLAGNTSGTRGAGLYAYAGGASTLTNVTIAGNVSQGYGGAVYAEVFTTHVSTVSLTNVTVRGNAASTSGGGIYADSGAVVSLTNTLLAKGSSGANCSAPFGGSSSLSDDSSCGFGAGDGMADLKLGPLSRHGGPTETIVPKAGSPAVDAGTSSGAPTKDQRGIVRPQGPGVDAGAVEVCPGKPAEPALIAPRNTILSHRRVVLDWKDVSCIQGYTVVVKRGSRTGPTVQKRTELGASTFKTKALRRDRTYYWRVTAVGDRGKTTSVWRHFRLA